VFVYTPARWGQRFSAFMLDLFILDFIRFPLLLFISPIHQPYTLFFINTWILFTYFAALESSPWRASFGQLIMGIRISRTDGEDVSFHQSLQRISLGMCFLGISFLRALWNPHSLALHDEYTRTCVVEEWWE
jgi:uncharacterized RDD family membrane protein YckC